MKVIVEVKKEEERGVLESNIELSLLFETVNLKIHMLLSSWGA